jgi:hypothetical protein
VFEFHKREIDFYGRFAPGYLQSVIIEDIRQNLAAFLHEGFLLLFSLGLRQLPYGSGEFAQFGECLDNCDGRLCGLGAFENGRQHV